jgi:hypothetical protein
MSAPRFLVDENLSVLLSEVAHPRGYEATHINHYGLRKSKDWGGTRGQDGTIRLLDLTDGENIPSVHPFLRKTSLVQTPPLDFSGITLACGSRASATHRKVDAG